MQHTHSKNCSCKECISPEQTDNAHIHSHNECSCANHEHSHGCYEHKEISVGTHEGAIIGTLSIHSNICYNELKSKCYSAIHELQEWALSNKYLIGHIKGYVESAEIICIFSTTGHDITVTESQTAAQSNNSLNIVCILFGLNKDILRDKLNKCLL